MINSNQILLSVQRALLFSVICKIRFIIIDVVEDGLTVNVYSDKQLNSDEIDIYYAFSAEVTGDFPSLVEAKSKVIFIVNKDIKYESLKYSGKLVYARYEI